MGSAGDIFSQLSAPPQGEATPPPTSAPGKDIFDAIANQPPPSTRDHMPVDAKDRYWKSLGLTSEGQSVGDAFTHDIQYMKNQPGAAAKELVSSPWTGYANAAAEQYQRAADHFHSGDYVGGLIHGLYYLLTPVGGSNLGRAADQSAQGDIAGAAGSMTLPALTVAAGSPLRPSIRDVRSVVGGAIEKNARPLGRATSIAAGAEIGGTPGALVGAALSPGATKLFQRVGAALKPGEAPISMMPLTRQVLGSPEMKAFLNSPGIEGEIVDREFKGGLPQGPHQLLLGPGVYELPEKPTSSAVGKIVDKATGEPRELKYVPPFSDYHIENLPADYSPALRDAETAAAQEGIDRNLFSNIYWKHSSPAMRDWEFMRRINHSMNAVESGGTPDFSLVKTKKLMSQPLDTKPYVEAAANSLGKEAKFSEVQTLAEQLKSQDEDMAHLLMKSIERVQDQKLLDRFAKTSETPAQSEIVHISPRNFLEKVGGAKNMNPVSVADAKAAYGSGKTVEPPSITFDGAGNVVEADGRHRALGAVQAGMDRIPVKVIRKAK